MERHKRSILRSATTFLLAAGSAASLVIAGNSPAAAVPSQALMYSVDGGATWSNNVAAAPGAQVLTRAWYNNDLMTPVSGASIQTDIPAGFTLVPNTTRTCLSPSTTDPTMPGTEQVCSTDSGQGGMVDDGSVWSGSTLTINPTAGLFGQPASGIPDAQSGYLATGKTRYVNLSKCGYYWAAGSDNWSTVTDISNSGALFDSGTSVSNTPATAPECGAGDGTSTYNATNSGYAALDLLGNKYVNLMQCDYYWAAGSDNWANVTDIANGGALFDSGTNTSNSPATAPTCGAGDGTSTYTAVNSGYAALDMLNNRYLNLMQCGYYWGAGSDNWYSVVDISNGGTLFDSGTNASNSPATAPTCGTGDGASTHIPMNSGYAALDTLDTTRGRGFVEFRMTAPFPLVTTPYDQTASMTGDGTSAGKITVVVDALPTVGDWGFAQGKWQVLPGHKLDPFIEVTCAPVPGASPVPAAGSCQYGFGMVISIKPLNGSVLLDNAVSGGTSTTGSQWDLNLKSTGARVGQCYVEVDKTAVTCLVVKNGTAAAGDSLITSVPVEMLTTPRTATPAFQVTWWNPHGEPQTGQTPGGNDLWGANDFLTIVTSPASGN
ncbi:hypothetical protein ACFCYM_35005 [Streptomyces sp. NPDC056254]|uniref:hypothetical protein n=1 Tax=Streptomyces sp. NPDC056254 TaxID=3345763 RepID=UPI0035DFC62F